MHFYDMPAVNGVTPDNGTNVTSNIGRNVDGKRKNAHDILYH